MTRRDPRLYDTLDAEGTTCPYCRLTVRLLSHPDWHGGLPYFYVCTCGFIGQVGVGPVAPGVKAHGSWPDGTERLVQALHGRKALPPDYIGGSQARMLHEAADRIEGAKAREAELLVLLREAQRQLRDESAAEQDLYDRIAAALGEGDNG